MHSSQLYTTLNFVRSSKCGAFLYSSLALNPRDFVQIPIRPDLTSKFGIIWKKGVFISNKTQQFIDFAKSYDLTPYIQQQILSTDA